MKKLITFICIVFLCITQTECQKLRWGILSTGRFADKFIDALRLSDKSEVAAVASRNLQTAEQFAKRKNIKQAYGSYDELIQDSSIDIIFNPLPNALHAAWTLKAINAGKHVLCEKPLVTSLEDLESIEKAAQEKQVVVFEGLAYLFHPQTNKLMELIKNDKIGDIRFITSWLHVDLSFFDQADKKQFRLDNQLGGGCLWDLGIYCASIAMLIAQAGAPQEVWATAITKNGVDMVTDCHMKFKNNIYAHFGISFCSSYSAGLYVHGTKGTLFVDSPWRPGLYTENSILFSTFSKQEKITTSVSNPYIYEIQEMESCVLEKRQPLVSLNTSKGFLRTLLAFHESIACGKTVKL